MANGIASFRIDWPKIFADAMFRRGWADRRGGKPYDYATGDGNSCYALGRLMAAEAPKATLPDVYPYYSMQMRSVVQQCPAMIDDICLSAMREAAQQGFVELHVDTGNGLMRLKGEMGE